MDHHPSCSGAPPAATRRWLGRAAFALLVAGLLVGCGSSDDDPMDATPTTPAADEAETGTDDASSGSAGFGDPADAGFAPVDDVEVDPVANDPAAVDLVDEDPDQVVARVAAELDAEQDESGGTGAGGLLDAVAAVDTGAPVGTDDGRTRNELGELVSLDEEASLACGQVEIAIDAVDAGDIGAASERLLVASGHAGRSAIADIRDWAAPLEDSAAASIDEPAWLIGFLTVCAEGGYEL
jgi:hypothetical protein